jgi:hypothetical protein
VTDATIAMLGKVGIGLLVVAALAIIAEMVLMGLWGLALGRRLVLMTERLEGERAQIRADLERLRRGIEETRALLEPYQRVLRWLRHPLVLALLGSFRRRMAAR